MASGGEWLTALVDVRGLEGERFVEVARSWLMETGRVLAGDLWGRLQASLPLVQPVDWEWDEPFGEPHGVWAMVFVVPGEGRALGELARPYSPESVEWMLSELRYRPSRAEFTLFELDGEGVPHELGGTLTVRMEVLEGHPEWVQFSAGSTLFAQTHSGMRPEVSDRWASVVRELVGQVDTSFGHICDDAAMGGPTALDNAVRRGDNITSITEGQEVLRGYSWVTVVPAGLVQRLGGAEAMRASEAFTVVDELPSGGLWLQATPHFADYDPAAVRRVFRALAPVLPAGQPKPNRFDEGPRRLIWDDAANWR